MLTRLLSNDYPRSRILAVILVALFLALAFTPFLFPGVKALNVAAKVLVFVVLVASFDLLLGYTGIVSFAHTMFFGIGAYGVAIASTRMGAGWTPLLLGIAVALALSFVLAAAIGLFSLRVRAIFFSMITLAFAAAFQTLASQLSEFTGGEDGLTFKMPEVLSPGFKLSETPLFGVSLDGRLICYYLLFVVALVLLLALLRIVNSPFGRVLQAIRENEFRAEAIGYRVVVYRTVSSVLSALFATLAGAMLAIWLRYNGPDTTLSFEIMLDVLLIVVIGGMGTIYGAAIGSGLFVVAQSYLQDLLKLGSDAASGLPWLAALLSPDRWLLWLGLLFVLSVYYFPTGVVGRLRALVPARTQPAPKAAPRSALGFTSNYVTCAGREIHYTEWGAGNKGTVIAWHGLARTGRDMDELAASLADRYRVICPDTIGRGYSQWSPDPGNEYQLSFYARLAVDLFEQLGIRRAHWVGTSMGGAIGTVCAGGVLRGRIQSLLLNDNAPRLATEAIARIRAYAGNPPAFDTMAQLEGFFRQVYKPFGWLSDAQWRRLTETSTRRLPDGRVTPHYDPAMVRQFTDHPHDYDLWESYDRIEVPVLLLRGAESDLVLRDAADEMLTRGPGTRGLTRVVEIEGCGHAPALNVPGQLELVRAFIDANEMSLRA